MPKLFGIISAPLAHTQFSFQFYDLYFQLLQALCLLPMQHQKRHNGHVTACANGLQD
jgi:hypothetical protein